MLYSPVGGTARLDTPFDELIRRSGGRNVAVDLGVAEFRRLSLERVIVADPDVIVLNAWRRWAPGFQQEFLAHPALRA